MTLPATIGVAEFDALHDDPARWRDDVAAIAARLSPAPVQPMTEGTALVALVGDGHVLKVYPPFLHDHFAFERAMLRHVEGRLPVPTPALLADGMDGEGGTWPWLWMTQLRGEPLTAAWPRLDETARAAVLRQIGATMAAVHALPVEPLRAWAPAWPDFLARQRAGCHGRQSRNGLPAHLLAQLDAFLAGPLPVAPDEPDVPLTGEYTPMNLLHDPAHPGRLSAMFDFGDGLVGPRAYDWLGPMCFLAGGDAARLDALFDGYAGRPFDRTLREPLLRLLLLHRYSCLPAQIACPGWQQASDFPALAARVWP
jgi:hygromycin-B 7''-O-kinase